MGQRTWSTQNYWVLANNGNPLSITSVYGQPVLLKRFEVWNKLKELKSIALPKWLCIGDFNQIHICDEKFSFNASKIPRADSFQQLID